MACEGSKVFHSQLFMGVVVAAAMLWIGGEVHLFSQTTIEDGAIEILQKLQIHNIPEPNFPIISRIKY